MSTSFWLSQSLTTQNWLVDRAEFVFDSMTSRISGFYINDPSYQNWGFILHSIAEEFAMLDARANFVFDQGYSRTLDPVFAHISEAPLFRLSASFPRQQWYDNFYRDFLVAIGRIYLQPSTTTTMKQLFTEYFKLPTNTTPNVQVRELWRYHATETVDTIVDQHIANIQVPIFESMDQTTKDLNDIFDLIRPAHVVLRFVVDPSVTGEWIHAATIKDPFFLKMYVIETRPPLKLLRWSDFPGPWNTGTIQDTATWTTWFKLSPGILVDYSQYESGVLSPAVQPRARYKVSSYQME
jgi:hypothetical protein